jgi:arginine decarboxylase
MDRWRRLLDMAGAWSKGSKTREEFDQALAGLSAVESFFAYPGGHLLAALRDSAAANEPVSVIKTVKHIGRALLTRSYRRQAEDWELNGRTETVAPDVLPPALGQAETRRPYFEVLIVTGAPAERWPAMCAEWRNLRRPLDSFVYEPVFVASVEDAFCAAMLNPELAAVVINDGYAFRSRYDAPVLRSLSAEVEARYGKDVSDLELADLLKRVRPELDIYLVSNGEVEILAGDPKSNIVRRVC